MTHSMELLAQATKQGTTGILALNRPKALNSLNHEMIELISAALSEWEQDDEITQVLLYSTSDRAFCAGGDVRIVRDQGVAGDYESGDLFFRDEYVMNHQLACYPKPIVALINGVAMGGGLGVSCHGKYRVITEKAFAAMPEMHIGFVPDVGMTWMMQRMHRPGAAPSPALAKFLGLTGYRLQPADLIWSGMATHYVPSDQLASLQEAIIADGVAAALAKYACPPPGEPGLAALLPQIEACFHHATFPEIAAAVAACEDQDFQDLVAQHLANAAPESLVACVELFHANENVANLRQALDNELAIGGRLRRTFNFAEGIRAVLIDKDRQPQFQPASWQEIDAATWRAFLPHRPDLGEN